MKKGMDDMLLEYTNAMSMVGVLQSKLDRMTEAASRYNSILSVIASKNGGYIYIAKEDMDAIRGRSTMFMYKVDEDGNIMLAMQYTDENLPGEESEEEEEEDTEDYGKHSSSKGEVIH